jgi:hypothetical protein
MAQFSLANFDKPTNKRWKFWSKFLTRTLPVYAGIIAVIPDATLNADLKVWIGVILGVIVATISGLSEFTTEDSVIPPQDGNQSPD